MTEYEANKEKLRKYRKRNEGGKLVKWLCNIMEWLNDRCIKN